MYAEYCKKLRSIFSINDHVEEEKIGRLYTELTSYLQTFLNK